MSDEGKCRNCMKRGSVFRAQRYSGGSYKRGGRWYWSHICDNCAALLYATANPEQRIVYEWSVASLRRVLYETGMITNA